MSNNYNFIVVGGGVVGLATAYKLQLKFPNKTIAILEKEEAVAVHQTGRNSGVIHSGIYYKPNSYKAKNCFNGRDQLVNFATKFNVPFEECGKLIVATKENELPMLQTIYKRGLQNKTPNIIFLSKEEIKLKEPYIEAIKAIYVPTAGIIDYVALCETFVKQIQKINKKSNLFTSCKVFKVKNLEVTTSFGKFYGDKIIFCTGLQSDRNAEKDNINLDVKIVGFRGDYYQLTPNAEHKINNLVYPVPDPKFPFLGVHFTRMINGGIECGPNAVFTFKREGYNKLSFSFKDTFEALLFKGTWKLFFKHWRKGIDEYKRAFSKQLFVKELQKMMPSLKASEVTPARSGVRAQAIDFDGNMVDDFKIVENENSIHVINAPSPAATACLAIADEITGYIK